MGPFTGKTSAGLDCLDLVHPLQQGPGEYFQLVSIDDQLKKKTKLQQRMKLELRFRQNQADTKWLGIEVSAQGADQHA